MAYGDKVNFRDSRGRFRKALQFEKNQYFQIRGNLLKGLANFEFKTGTGVGEAAQKFAEKAVQYMQDNAPWQDQTGDARAGLHADVTLTENECTVQLAHTVDYGVWLEIRWGGRYAIIIPTIEQLGPELYDAMSGMCGEIIYYVD